MVSETFQSGSQGYSLVSPAPERWDLRIFPDAVLLRPQGDIGKTSIEAGDPVETAEPEGQVDCRQTDETPPSSDHVYFPGAFALDLGHESVPPLSGELYRIRIDLGGWHPQGQVGFKVGDEAHILEGPAQGKEELFPVMPVGVGVPEEPSGGPAGQDVTFPQVHGINHGAKYLPAVQA